MFNHILFNLIQVLVVMAFAPLASGVLSRLKEMVQSKRGPSIFQPYRDLWKLFHKDEIVSEDSSWIFRFTPYIVFVTPIFVVLLIPVLTNYPLFFAFMGDMLGAGFILALGGFADFTAMYRSTNVGGIGTQFGSIPYSNTPNGQLSETRLSAQNSRLKFKVTSKIGKTHVTGYLESDFLGVQPASAYVTSNSDSLRMRLYWVDLQRGKFELLAGQSWSMLTPNRRGISPDPSDIFFTDDMDTNYQVGLVWSRDAQLRVIDHINRNWTLGVSLENPNQYVGSSVVLPNSAYASQFDTGGNTGASNPRPDVIAKLAYDGRWGGHRVHGEIAGLISGFHDAVPGTLATNSATGAGGELDGNIELLPHLDLVLNSFFSDGGGRYLFGLGPDLIVRPDGQISPVHSASTLDGFEYQFRRRWMAYGYYGAAYYGRDYVLGPGGPVGYGFPGSSSGSNRAIQEGTFGVIHTFWKQPRYGALQLITQYSYLTRAPWWMAPGAPRNASLNMVYADLRYVLP